MTPTPTNPPASSLILDPLALDRLREGGGPELIVELIDLFLVDGPGLLAAIQGAAGADALGRAAHALKGSCLSLGLNELGELCRRIEHATEAGDPCEVEVSHLDAAYARATEALQAARDRP